MARVVDGVELERMGLPGITIASDAFIILSQFTARSKGLPELPLVVVPHGLEHWPEEKIRELAENVAPQIVNNLTTAA